MQIVIKKNSVSDALLACCVLFGPPVVVLMGVLAFLVSNLQHLRQLDITATILLLIWPIWSIFVSGEFVLTEFVQVCLVLLVFGVVFSRIRSSGELELTKIFRNVGIFYASIEILISQLDISYGSILKSGANNIAAQFALLFLVIPSLMRDEMLIKRLLCITLGAGVAYVNESRTVLALSIIIFLIVAYSFRTTQRILIFCFSVIFLAYAFLSGTIQDSFSSLFDMTTNFSNLERLRLFEFAWYYFMENPLGTGVGTSLTATTQNPFTASDTYPHAHNTFLFLAMEIGIMAFGVVFILLILGSLKSYQIAREDKDTRLLARMAALCAISLVDALFYNGILSVLTIILIAEVFGRQKYLETRRTLRERTQISIPD